MERPLPKKSRAETLPSWWKDESKFAARLYSVTILGTLVVVPVLLFARFFLNFRNLYYMSHVEAAWLTNASDFVNGVFYRPLVGPLGHGGTRFFPLYFVLTGTLSNVFGQLERSGLIVSGASVVLLGYGSFVLLRRLGVSRRFSLAALVGVLVASTTQEALLQTKGDGLAAMLNLWGIIFCLGEKTETQKRWWPYIAAILFSLAFAAKMTTVFGFASVILVWVLAGRYRDALRLGLATCCGFIMVLSAIYLGSSGRALEIFRVCAAGGGSLRYALEAPLQMIGTTLQFDPIVLLFSIPAAAIAFSYFQKVSARILPVYFLVVLAATTMIFGSRGTLVNHLIDLHVAGVLLLTYFAFRISATSEIGTGIIALGLLVGCVQIMIDLHSDFSKPSLRAEMQSIADRIHSDNRPVLAENPYVVLQSGKTPYLLDAFMFRVASNKYPELRADLREKLWNKGFAAVVLERDPGSVEGKQWYKDIHFGGEFVRDLEANYSFSYRVGRQYVYIPKTPES